MWLVSFKWWGIKEKNVHIIILLVWAAVKWQQEKSDEENYEQRTRLALTKVRLIGTTLQLHSFRAALDQEVPHQLVGDVTCNNEGEGVSESYNIQLINLETSPHIIGIEILTSILSPPWLKTKKGEAKSKLNTWVIKINTCCIFNCSEVSHDVTQQPAPTFLVLMHRRRGRGHLHSQAVRPPEWVTVPDNKGSRFPLSQQANGCNTVNIQIWVDGFIFSHLTARLIRSTTFNPKFQCLNSN